METTPGKRVRMFREHIGYKTASAFAEVAGLKVATLSSIETDRTSPSFDILATLTAAFPELNTDWLLNGTGSMLRGGRNLVPMEAPAVGVQKQQQVPMAEREPLQPARMATSIDFQSRLVASQDSEISLLKKANEDKDAFIEELLRTIEDLRADKAELRKKPEGNRLAATASSAAFLSIHRFGSDSTRRLRAQRRQLRQERVALQERKRVGFGTMRIVREAA